MKFQVILLIFGCITSTLAVYNRKSCRKECLSSEECGLGSVCKAVGCNLICKTSGILSTQLGLNGGIGSADSLLSADPINNKNLLANGGVIGGRRGLVGGSIVGDGFIGKGQQGLIHGTGLLSGRNIGFIDRTSGAGLAGRKVGLIDGTGSLIGSGSRLLGDASDHFGSKSGRITNAGGFLRPDAGLIGGVEGFVDNRRVLDNRGAGRVFPIVDPGRQIIDPIDKKY